MITRIKSPEFSTFIIIFCGLSILLPSALTASGVPLWVIVFLEFLIIGASFELSEIIAAAVVKEYDLPKLIRLHEYPPVAILFLVCDDLVPAALSRLHNQRYPRADIFILDDSKDPRTQRLLDEAGFLRPIVRRPNRRGHKAGSLNNWLKHHGKDYKYFLILDSDSIVEPDFLESIIKYAEHQANARVAIFNSLPECWNTNLRFVRFLSVMTPVQNWIRIRLANRSPSLLSTGHNNLHRTGAVFEAGGFDERFAAEDIAVTLSLFRAGYTSRLVNLIGYEAEPEHIFSYLRRLIRWSRQTVQIQRADWQDIPLLIKFQMFKLTWMYLSFFLYLIWAVLIAWGSSSSFSDLRLLIESIFSGDRRAIASLTPLFVIVLFTLAIHVIKIPLLIKFRISPRKYAGNYLLMLAIAFYSMLLICWAQIWAAAHSTMDFDVTDKSNHPVKLSSIFFHHRHLIPFWLFLVAGFWQNPVSFFFSSLWMMVLLLAPVLIYFFHGECLSGSETGYSSDDPGLSIKSQ